MQFKGGCSATGLENVERSQAARGWSSVLCRYSRWSCSAMDSSGGKRVVGERASGARDGLRRQFPS